MVKNRICWSEIQTIEVDFEFFKLWLEFRRFFEK